MSADSVKALLHIAAHGRGEGARRARRYVRVPALISTSCADEEQGCRQADRRATGMAKAAEGARIRQVPRCAPCRGRGDRRPRSGQERREGSRFAKAIIAAGSQSVQLPFVPEDPRIFDSTGALELPSIPKRMLVVGGGIIGLEMGTVYSTLGARLDVVEMLDGLMQGADRDLVRVCRR